MDGGEETEIVPSRAAAYAAGVAEQQREDRGERCPNDERGHQATGQAAKSGSGDVGYQLKADRGALRHRAKRRRAQNRVSQAARPGSWPRKRRDEEHREQNGTRNGPLGPPHFAAQKADVVVAPVAISGEQRSLRKAASAAGIDSAPDAGSASRRWPRRGKTETMTPAIAARTPAKSTHASA